MTPKTLKLASLYQLLLAVMAGGLAQLLWREHASGVFSGALVMAVNFFGLWFVLRGLQYGVGTASKGFYSILLMTKLIAVFAVVAFLVLEVRVSALGLAVGMMTMLIGMGFAVVHTQLRVFGTGEIAPQRRM